MMFDAQNFSVVVVTGKAWDKLGDNGIFYSYAWRNKNQKLSEKAQKDKAVDVKDELLGEHVMLTLSLIHIWSVKSKTCKGSDDSDRESL